MKNMHVLFGAMTLMACLSGCHKIVDWEKDHFYQGERYFPDVDDPFTPRNIIKHYIRQLRVYDEFGTLGLFDVLILNHDVRRVYVELHAARMGFSTEIEEQLMRREMAEHEDALSFYIFAYAPDSTMPLDEEGNAPWTVLLRTPDGEVRPRSVRVVELAVEYKYLLNDWLSKHKTMYLVKFDRPGTPFELEFKLPDRYACVSWDKPAEPAPVQHPRRRSMKARPAHCVPGRPAMHRASQETIV